MTQLLLTHLIDAIHCSHGPNGVVLWIQPPHISAGVALLRNGLTGWYGVQA